MRKPDRIETLCPCCRFAVCRWMLKSSANEMDLAVSLKFSFRSNLIQLGSTIDSVELIFREIGAIGRDRIIEMYSVIVRFLNNEVLAHKSL